jgi:AhpD family alkylhydroperoxidase
MSTTDIRGTQPRADTEGTATRSAYRAMCHLDNAVGALESLDPLLGDLIRLRASMINGCAYCVDMHSKDARAKGETEQRLYAVAAWHEAPFFTPAERAAFALTDALTKLPGNPLPDAIVAEAEQQLGADGLAAATWVIVVINAWNRVAIASHSEAGHYEPGE